MGLPFSCPLGDFDDLDRRFEAVLVRSLSLGSGDVKTALRSLSFNGHDSKPTVLEPCSSGNLLMEGSLSYERRELETMFPFRTPTAAMENQAFTRTATVNNRDINNELPRINSYSKKDSHPELSGHGSRRYQAAIQLQKVYKSFRTRRQLADCAVLVEQRWWKLLDFAELKRSSISFFDIEKPETAISRWSRARKRAAKVGKGLSKDEKARKLALQHWLEAIDPRHRYGHNLQFYYVTWLHCESKQPFFYWLDIGEGKEANLEICPRSKLQQQCIKYLGPTERKAYEVVIKNGRFVYKPSGEVLDTRGGPRDTKWIFVLSASKTLYVGQKKKGTFQHSSFLAGGATLSAGRLVVEDGILKAVWPHSGHYLPTEENFEEFMSFLKEHDVDLTNVQKSPTEEDEETVTKKGNDIGILGNKTYQEVSQDDGITLANENADSKDVESGAERNPDKPAARLTQRLLSRIARLEIPTVGSVYDIFKTETLPTNSHDQDSHHDQDSDCASEDGYETAEDSFLSEEDFMHPKVNLFGEDGEEEAEEPIPKEKIMQRIDSHKGMKSYQLAQQLSSRWTTGAGPRISCMRDYPPELQFWVLEQAHLSPRASSTNFSPGTRTCFSPTLMTPTSLHRQASAGKSPLAVDQNKKMSLKATS